MLVDYFLPKEESLLKVKSIEKKKKKNEWGRGRESRERLNPKDTVLVLAYRCA